jgi:hypothetical protein
MFRYVENHYAGKVMRVRRWAAIIFVTAILAIGASLVLQNRSVGVTQRPIERVPVRTIGEGENKGALSAVLGSTSFSHLGSDRPVAENRENPSTGNAIDKFEKARTCHARYSERANMEAELNVCNAADKNEVDFVRSCRKNTEGLDAKIRQVSSDLASCSAVPAEIEADYYASTKTAAKAGDFDAQLCYLEGNFDIKQQQFIDHEIDDYKSAAVNYVNFGLARGDWRIPELLGVSPKALRRSGPFLRRELIDGEPYMQYQMNRLLRLGADGEYARILDMRAATLVSSLTTGEVVQAEDWASVVYGANFRNVPRLADAPIVCGGDKFPTR